MLSGEASNTQQPVLTFDPEWLAITRAFNPFMSVGPNQMAYPDEAEARGAVQRELEWVKENVYGLPHGNTEGNSTLSSLVKTVGSCQKFTITAPGPGTATGPDNVQREFTFRLCLKG